MCVDVCERESVCESEREYTCGNNPHEPIISTCNFDSRHVQTQIHTYIKTYIRTYVPSAFAISASSVWRAQGRRPTKYAAYTPVLKISVQDLVLGAHSLWFRLRRAERAKSSSPHQMRSLHTCDWSLGASTYNLNHNRCAPQPKPWTVHPTRHPYPSSPTHPLTYVYIHIYMNIYINICTSYIISLSLSICLSLSLSLRVRDQNIYTHVYMYIYIYIYIFICRYIYRYILICRYRYIHR